jgi:hypothetical protein
VHQLPRASILSFSAVRGRRTSGAAVGLIRESYSAGVSTGAAIERSTSMFAPAVAPGSGAYIIPPMRAKDTTARRAKLTRKAHKLARSGRYENAAAVIEAIRQDEDFHPNSHETSAFRGALDAICKRAKDFPMSMRSMALRAR